MTGAAAGIVMTDLFVSATAVLLLVLAVVQPTPPVQLPIQADLVARCLEAGQGSGAQLALSAGTDPTGPGVLITDPADLVGTPARLGLPPRLFYTIAVVGTQARPVTAACLSLVERDFVRAHNDSLIRADRRSGAPRAIFAVAVAVPETAEGVQ